MSKLKKHTRADKIKWIITSIVLIALIGAIIGLSIKLDRQTTTTTIGGEAYSIGTIDSNGDYAEGNTAIYMRKGITTDGLKCELKKDARIEYTIYFYNADGEFISATDSLNSSYTDKAPEGAESAKIMITPTEDEDGKVSIVEVLGYANQLIVTVNR